MKRGSAKKSAAKRPAVTNSAAKRSAAKKNNSTAAKKPARRSPMSRVTRVAKEVAQQATTAVTGGLETVKEFGESIVDRVTS